MAATETKHGEVPVLAWVLALVLVTALGILSIIRLAIREDDGDAQPTTDTTTAAARTAPAAPISRVIEVDSVWVEVGIPPHHLFRTDVEDTVLVRNLFGEIFEKTPDGTILRDGVPVEEFGDPIPGLKLFFKAGGEPTRFVFSTWPES